MSTPPDDTPPDFEYRKLATMLRYLGREMRRGKAARINVPRVHRDGNLAGFDRFSLDDVEATCLEAERLARIAHDPQPEAEMKLRTASESLGWMNSVGPLSVSPGKHNDNCGCETCESRSPDGDGQDADSCRGAQRAAPSAAFTTRQAGSEPADSHQPEPAAAADRAAVARIRRAVGSRNDRDGTHREGCEIDGGRVSRVVVHRECAIHRLLAVLDRQAAALDAAQRERDEALTWKDAVTEALVVNFIEPGGAEQTLANLIEWEVKMALDPMISKKAQELIERGAASRTVPARLRALVEQWRADGSPAIAYVTLRDLAAALAAEDAPPPRTEEKETT